MNTFEALYFTISILKLQIQIPVRCAPGYFGFPECKQCNCPITATCNEETGDCICAPFVSGTPDNPCSVCEENTFGYDPITGCQECKCNVEGTMTGKTNEK